MHSLGLCPHLSKIRLPLVDSNVHPISSICFFKPSFRMMSVLAVKTNSRFGRSPIIYFGIPGVPSLLLPIMTSVPCGVRFS